MNGIISPENEVVRLTQAVNVNEGDKKGNVEKWLFEIEQVMRLTLNHIAKKSLRDKSTRAVRIFKYPAMTVLMDNMIWW